MEDDINYTLAAYRICTPEETFEKIEPIIKEIGVTRTARIDGLDRIGIPVFSSIRPSAKDGAISVYAGKGATEIQAKVSSTMEAIERYSAEFDENSKLELTKEPENPINLDDLILPGGKSAEYTDTKGIDWVIGKDIISGKSFDVPINSAVHPHDGKKLFRSNTNGLASGNSEEEAVFHGMLEVIERDAWSISELSKNTYRKVNVENAKNPLIFELLEKFKKAKINIILKDLTSEVGIPTVAAISDDDVLKDPALLCMGVGCHLHPEIAVLRALTEVAQSRATQIHGAREDTNRGDVVRKISYDRMKRAHKKWYTFKNEINIEDMPNNAKLNLKKDIETVKEILKQNGFDKIITVKLNKTDIDVSRVIIPKMEMYSVDRDRISLWIKDRIRRNLESNLNLI
ncbi:YcaO-related McrA-glycine thioamidation protein [Methanococcus maripaludis]|uniref:YcaO domain-containing protein n=4 Tax=Methanococcus maripaludis TaxID=39152 RepID=Q6LYD5_METMP|nr:YcaO-related McrA-glycine thioamidation protein [Methanococcus maripaludis]MBA2857972.1 ribosomal protein S12 methylthiotransferase accessory factor [Methanococcus maripaludis]MBB6066806.1 ribosomal protein S12 methylthiotransferase accessory factor [Methanococcus maripaludis]CAF30612.1 conserved hypothetical protein [Methanococcus maripaludis S2]